MQPHDQSFCPKCGRMYCEGYWNEGVCIADMHFCGEPTADGDASASYLRAWYEAHRETYLERNGPIGKSMFWKMGTADNLMLGMLNEVSRISGEQERQHEQRKDKGLI